MKRIFIRPVAFAMLVAALMFSCGGNETQTAEDHHTGPDTLPPADTSSGGIEHAKPTRLKDLADAACAAIFSSEYSRVDPEETDLTQKFMQAESNDIRRYLIMKEYRNNDRRAVYPRTGFYATRFADSTTLHTAVEARLHEMKREDPAFKLGTNVNQVKSGPFVAAVMGRDYFVLRSSCVYAGSEWDRIADLFVKHFRAQGATFIFRVTCADKNLEYLK